MRIFAFDSYEEAAPLWRELEGSYKSGGLTLDLEAHRIVWEGFYRPRGAELRIFAAVEGGRCVGIFPFLHTADDPAGRWTFTDDFIIAREYFCPPGRVHEILPLLPPHLADDLSCFYEPRVETGFRACPGGVADLMATHDEYFASLDRKDRQQLRRCLKLNEDVRVERDVRVRREDMTELEAGYLASWARRASGKDDRLRYSRDKIATDLALMERASRMGKLVALYFFLDGNLVAANFSVLRDVDRVDDYICLRNAEGDLGRRGLGIHAILRNMEVCRGMGVRYYDFSACLDEYKLRFLNTRSKFFVWADGPTRETRAPEGPAEGREEEPAGKREERP
jgi:hypothetical protein